MKTKWRSQWRSVKRKEQAVSVKMAEVEELQTENELESTMLQRWCNSIDEGKVKKDQVRRL